MKSYLKQYIDGAWVDSDGGRIHQVIDPSTEQPCTEITLGTAIDVDKILSAEVSDTAWSAYLRGDRGVFTRRAVRLIDNGEAKDIASAYENDPEFFELVNRYIHDFEAILRNLLGTRDGSSLSVALLSSDMGKLYVMLAQAIERLRT